MRIINILFVFFTLSWTFEIAAAPTVKRFCLTSKINKREPTDQLTLAEIKNQQFHVFIELQNCEKSKFLLKITTIKGVLKRPFITKKGKRYRTHYMFKNLSSIISIEVIDSTGNVLSAMPKDEQLSNDNAKSNEKSHKTPRGMKMKKLLQSMQD